MAIGISSDLKYGLKSLLRQGLPELEFYVDFVYRLKKNVGSNNFSTQFVKNNFPLLNDWL